MKKALLFINGEPPTRFPLIENYDRLFCTDGAYHYLANSSIIPDVISGDFDSMDISLFPEESDVITTPDQNLTDLQKVFKIIIAQGFQTVDIYGASGKQQDHFLGNLTAVQQVKNELSITLYDQYGYYFFAEKECVIDRCINKIVSLYPFPKAKKVETVGLEYPLFKENLSMHGRIGTRNKAVNDTVEIRFEEGELIVFVLNEKEQ